MKSIYKSCGLAVVAAVAFTSVAANGQSSMEARQDRAQLKSDEAALQRALKRLDADEARMKADKASGKMSAESKDSEKVYNDQQAVKGAKSMIATDVPGSLQMKADKEALQRALKRLAADQAMLKADKRSGKMAAESKDSINVYRDQQSVKAEQKQTAADKAELKAINK